MKYKLMEAEEFLSCKGCAFEAINECNADLLKLGLPLCVEELDCYIFVEMKED